jgi:hypothetical protein
MAFGLQGLGSPQQPNGIYGQNQGPNGVPFGYAGATFGGLANGGGQEPNLGMGPPPAPFNPGGMGTPFNPGAQGMMPGGQMGAQPGGGNIGGLLAALVQHLQQWHAQRQAQPVAQRAPGQVGNTLAPGGAMQPVGQVAPTQPGPAVPPIGGLAGATRSTQPVAQQAEPVQPLAPAGTVGLGMNPAMQRMGV